MQTPAEMINVGQVVMSSNSGSADSQPKEMSPVIVISDEESSAVTVNQKPTAVLNPPDTIVISEEESEAVSNAKLKSKVSSKTRR